jgi:hypothetical protein
MIVSNFTIRMIGSTFLFVVGSYLITYIVFSDKPYIFINSPANAISSLSYALIDAPLPVKLPLMVLSIASYSLWSNSNTIINFVDVTSIFWVIIAVTIHTLPNARYSRHILALVNSAFIASISVAIYTLADATILEFYEDNLVVVTALIYTMCSIFMASFYCSSKTFVAGYCIISFGFICKLLTIFFDQYWGTCVFHIASAIGIGFLLKLQTIQEPLCNFVFNPMTELVTSPSYGRLDPVILCRS